MVCTKGEEEEDEEMVEVVEGVEGDEESPISLHPSGNTS